MPFYVVKVKDRHGWLRPPIVANFPTEEEAIAAIRVMVEDTDAIEVKGIRDDVMKAAFGSVPEGAAIFRGDWTWRGEGENRPEPY